MKKTHVVGATLAVMIGLCGALQVSARVSGGKPNKSDCYVELDGVTQTKVHPNPIVECVDGDPACDTDGECNQSCTFSVAVCVNQTDVPGCTPPAGGLRRLDIKGAQLDKPALDGSACGAFTAIEVPLKSKAGGKKLLKGRHIINMIAKPQKGVKPPTDVDKITLACLPKPGGCTTSTTVASTTSSTEATTSTTESTTSTTETTTTTSTTMP